MDRGVKKREETIKGNDRKDKRESNGEEKVGGD